MPAANMTAHDDDDEAVTFTCLACDEENALRAPRGRKFVKTTGGEAPLLTTRCASCGHAQEIEPLGWRLVKLAQQERSRESEGEVARAFKEVYKRNLALRGTRHTLFP